MAITATIAPTVLAVAPAVGNEFIPTGPFVFYGDNFSEKEKAHLMRLGPSGAFVHATNKDGRIFVSAHPNMVYVDAKGTYRIDKDATAIAASVGYEEQ
jgi:hypothetical protein